jgi:dihydroorotate dehydrogenase
LIDLYPIAGPLLRRLDPETAHGVTIAALKGHMAPRSRMRDDPILRSNLWGLDFANPVGLAAGFDKNAEVADAMLAQGFGFIEIGSVTPRPQPGNPRPRAFRVPEAKAMINRYGFNNDGLDVVAGRLEARRGRPGLVGANVGKNKETVDAAADYVLGIRRLAPLASYLVINVSSPNTPGLRALQGREPLAELLDRALTARGQAIPAGDKVPPLLLKIAPDLTEEDKRDIAEVALPSGIDGLIVSNTTIARPPELPAGVAKETGGLSGAPLMAASTAVLADMYRLTAGGIPLIGCGGIASGRDAYAKIRAGASLVQLYTALVYHGPRLVEEIRRDLATLLRADGFTGLRDAVGADHRQGSQAFSPDQGTT